MSVSPADIVNRAIQLIGGFNNQGPVTGSPPAFDSTPYGKAAGVLYNSVIQTVGRQFGWDFSRNVAALVLTVNTAPLGYAFEYLYPTNGIQVRQLLPTVITDPMDPLPLSWTVGNVVVSGTPKKVIWTNLAAAKAVFTNQPVPDLWDALFTEAVVSLLASELATAIPGKPQDGAQAFNRAAAFESAGEARTES